MRCNSFPPSVDENAKILILGSMPGVESLRKRQYYAFKYNAFWEIMNVLYGVDSALPYEARLAALRGRGIALWDVLENCERDGSLDAAIRNARPNDIPGLLRQVPGIRKIFCNGGASYSALRRFFPSLPVPVEKLVSTSPAAAGRTRAEKLDEWKRALSESGADILRR